MPLCVTLSVPLCVTLSLSLSIGARRPTTHRGFRVYRSSRQHQAIQSVAVALHRCSRANSNAARQHPVLLHPRGLLHPLLLRPPPLLRLCTAATAQSQRAWSLVRLARVFVLLGLEDPATHIHLGSFARISRAPRASTAKPTARRSRDASGKEMRTGRWARLSAVQDRWRSRLVLLVARRRPSQPARPKTTGGICSKTQASTW